MLRLCPNRSCQGGWLLPLVLMVIWCLLAPVVFAAGPSALPGSGNGGQVCDGSRLAPAHGSFVMHEAGGGGRAGSALPGVFRILGVKPSAWECRATMEMQLDRERTVTLELLSHGGKVLSRQEVGRLPRGFHRLNLPRAGVWGQVLTARLVSEGESRSLRLLMIE